MASGSADSLEDTGLVYVEDSARERERGNEDIRVEHTISIERSSGDHHEEV